MPIKRGGKSGIEVTALSTVAQCWNHRLGVVVVICSPLTTVVLMDFFFPPLKP
jgi:hypothetical protein